MPKKYRNWIQERTHDSYYRKAKQEGFVSRSAYKLKQLNTKCKLFQTGQTIIDLCCAPGGWLQICRDFIGPEGRILGIDLVHTKSKGGATTIKADITNDAVVEAIRNAGFDGADVIVSDCSPKLTGISELDTARQLYLAESALKIALEVLKKNGSFVSKVLQNVDVQEFIQKVKKYFRSISLVKPKSSLPKSREFYIVAKGFRKRSP